MTLFNVFMREFLLYNRYFSLKNTKQNSLFLLSLKSHIILKFSFQSDTIHFSRHLLKRKKMEAPAHMSGSETTAPSTILPENKQSISKLKIT